MGMVLGPFTQAEATTACQCRTDELCVGGMAGIQEADKVRTIFDAAIVGEANADKKTIAPALFDLLVGCQQGASQSQGNAALHNRCRQREVLAKHGGAPMVWPLPSFTGEGWQRF